VDAILYCADDSVTVWMILILSPVMSSPQPASYCTPDEYYRLEETSPERHEWFNGEMFAMAGGTTPHSLIKVNLVSELRQALKGRRCFPTDSDQRVKVTSSGLRTYPDAAVFCGPIEYDPEDRAKTTAINPVVLFEVLSESIEGYDRGRKAENYRTIPSLQAYVLLSQHDTHAEVYERGEDGTWKLTEWHSLDASLHIACIETTLKLAELYDRVEFPAASAFQIVKEHAALYRTGG
jgi:Uma2 family endonuclease